MPACAAYGCKVGYGGSKPPANVSLHRFPLSNPELLARWLRHLKRDRFVPKKTSRICSLHFSEDSFKTESSDSNLRRNRSSAILKRRILKEDAVPRINDAIPESKKAKQSPKKRKSAENVAASARALFDEFVEEDRLNQQLEADQINTIGDIGLYTCIVFRQCV